MTICLPTLDARGLAAELSQHFGRSPYFTLVDRAADRVETIENPRSGHGGGSCSAAELLRGRSIQAVVCRGLGQGAFGRLRAMGVPVFLSERSDVAGALEDLLSGRARPMGRAHACSGHGEPEGCGH